MPDPVDLTREREEAARRAKERAWDSWKTAERELISAQAAYGAAIQARREVENGR